MPPTDHPEYAALLRAIGAAPDDDTPRLVAADWLDEHGDADRAAFIRAQVELARLEASGLGKSLDADGLRKKERAFLGPFSVAPSIWAAEACPELVRVIPGESGTPLESIRVEGAGRLVFRRGFVEAVMCPASDWLKHGAAIRKRQPIRVVDLTWCGQLTRDHWYAMLSALRGLRELYLTDGDRGMIGWIRSQLPGVLVSDIPF